MSIIRPPADVRYGLLADIAAQEGMSALPPKADMGRAALAVKSEKLLPCGNSTTATSMVGPPSFATE